MIEKLSNKLKELASKSYGIKQDTLFLEVCTQNGETIKNNIKNGYYIEINKETIKNGFNFGAGTIKNYLDYAEVNKNFVKVYKVNYGTTN